MITFLMIKSTLSIIILFIPFLFFANIIHELGHGCASLMCKVPIIGFRFGKGDVGCSKTFKGYKIIIKKHFYKGAEIIIGDIDNKTVVCTKNELFIIATAGLFVNFLAITTCFIIGLLFKDNINVFINLIVCFGVLNLVILIENSRRIPYRDGWHIDKLRRGEIDEVNQQLTSDINSFLEEYHALKICK